MANMIVPAVAGLASNILLSLVTPVQKIGKLDATVLTPRASYGSPLPLAYGRVRLDGCPMFWALPLTQTQTSGKTAAKNGIAGNPAYPGSGKGFGPRENIYNYYMTAAFMIGGPIAGINRIWANNVQIYNAESSRAGATNLTNYTGLTDYNYITGFTPKGQPIYGGAGLVAAFSSGGSYTDKHSQYFADHSEIFIGNQTTISSIISAAEGNNIPAFVNRSYITFNNYNIAQFNGNGFPKIDVEIFGKLGPNPLITDIITDICLQCGLNSSQIDVSDIMGIGISEGMVLQRSGETFADYIEELQKLFFIVIREENGVIKFLNKNRPSITLNIGLANLGTNLNNEAGKTGDLFKETILPIREMASEIQISYHDLAWFGDQTTAYARNPLSQGQNPVSIQTRQWAGSTNGMAAGCAAKLIGEIITQRNSFSNMSLLPCWFNKLHIGDVIGVNIGQRQVQIQLTKLLLTKDFICQIEGTNYRSLSVPAITRHWVICSFTCNDPAVFLNIAGANQNQTFVGQTLYTVIQVPKYGTAAGATIRLACPVIQQLEGFELVGNYSGVVLYTSPVWGVSFSDGSFIPLSSPPVGTYGNVNAPPQYVNGVNIPHVYTSPSGILSNPRSAVWGYPMGTANPSLYTNVQIYSIFGEQIDPNTVSSNYSISSPWISNPSPTSAYAITTNYVSPIYDPRSYVIHQAGLQSTGNINPPSPVVYNPYPAIAYGLLTVYDINLVSDNGSPIGPYFAVQNQANFNGGSVYYSTDGGNNYYLLTTITKSATLGTISGTLSAVGNPDIVDTSTSFTITSNNVINSVTTDTFLAGQNLILVGSEIIAFRDVTLLGNNQYKLSYLIRGCRGTENYIANHSANEKFVLLDSTLAQAKLSQSDINKSYLFKLVPLNQVETDITTTISLTYRGNSCKPYAPADFTIGNDGSGNLILNWTRRTYQKGGLVDYADIGWSAGEMSQYLITTPNNKTYQASNVTFTYSASKMTADGYTPMVGDVFTVQQYSSYVGLGYATTSTYKNIVLTANSPDNTIGAYGGTASGGTVNLGNGNTATTYYQLLTITSNGQTSFTLSETPTTPAMSELFLNGVKAVYSINYSITGTTLTWTGVTLNTSETLEIYYY